MRCTGCGRENPEDARFCSGCGRPLAGAKHRAAEITGERKPVTILFVDVVGSTSLAERMDAEDWKSILDPALGELARAVERYDGTVAQFLGDGFLAFFGAPVTHEDDPSRAVRAGLEMVDRATEYAKRVPHVEFAIRVGINSGVVVLGPVGSDMKFEYLAVGDAVNVAARLQGLAPAMGIAVGESTYRGVETEFEWRPLGSHAVKGKSAQVTAYLPIAAAPARPTRASGPVPTPLVGRDAELARLDVLLDESASAVGQIAVVVGEPGIGKSRLLREWRERTARATRAWVVADCVAHGAQVPYHLVAELLRSARSEGAAAAAEDDAFVRQLLGAPLAAEDAARVAAVPPQALPLRYRSVLWQHLAGLAKDRTVVVVCNDVHWADPSSAALVADLLPLAAEARVVFCFVTRPDQDVPGWTLVTKAREQAGAALTEIALGPLSDAESERLVREVLGIAAFELGDVAARADGNPLFLEELVRWAIDVGRIARSEVGWTVGSARDAGEIPDTLRGLLHSRIDRLPEDPRRTLRVASVIGRRVPLRLLETVRSGDARADISGLEAADLLRLGANGDSPVYEFKHALIQDVAYASLLRDDRRRLHAAVADAIAASAADENVDALAHHYDAADDPRAAKYLTLAARRAKGRYANAEAANLYRRAIARHTARAELAALSEELGDVLDLSGERDKARVAYAQAIEPLGADEAIARARLFAKRGASFAVSREHTGADASFGDAEAALEVAPSRDAAWWSQWLDVQVARMTAAYWAVRPDIIDATAARVEGPLEQHGTPAQRMHFHRAQSMSAYRRERYRLSDSTVTLATRSLAAAREVGDPGMTGFAIFNAGFAHLWHGDLDEAKGLFSESLTVGEQTGDVTLVSRCWTYLAVVARMRRDAATVRERTKRAETVARVGAMPEYTAMARANQAWLSWHDDDDARAIDEAGESLRISTSLRPTQPFVWLAVWPLVAALRRQGRTDDAIDAIAGLLEPTQMRLPDELEHAVRDTAGGGVAAIDRALEMAQRLGYL